MTTDSATVQSSQSLQTFFNPESVAVIGASQNQSKVGYVVLKNLREGFQGELFAINPKYENVNSVECFDSIAAIGRHVDLAVVCTPASTVASIVEQCGQMEVTSVVILTAGFMEAGDAGCEYQPALENASAKYPAMRIVGPNCVGLINAESKLNASFACGMPANGRISFISQSGALCTAVLDWALQEKIGFANFVSVGNMVDVGWGEFIDHFADDPNTDAIVLYIESVEDADRFIAAADRCCCKKPIIAFKAGRFRQSAEAAASHTGALAGEDVVYEAVFRRLGIQRVNSVEEMFDTAEALARIHRNSLCFQEQPTSPMAEFGRLAIVSNAGGPAVMATDALIENEGSLAKLSDETMRALTETLPANWSKQNPVDVIGDATPERLAQATQIVLSDPQVDAVLVIVSPQAMTKPTECAAAILDVATRHNKPILTSWMGGVSMQDATEQLNRAGLPTFPTPERAIRAFVNLAQYQQNKHSGRSVLVPAIKPSTVQLGMLPTEVDVKQLLAKYEIEVVSTYLAQSEDEAVEQAKGLGFPVVVKIASPEIIHKSDFGGVCLNVCNEQDVRYAYRAVMAAAHEHHPQEIIMGVSVQPMIDTSEGYELIAGIKRDPVFGPVVMVGAGGVNAEVFKDVAFELSPLDAELAKGMLMSLKSWPILNGFRGQPILNVEAVVDALIKLSHLSLAYPGIMELDINPLLVTADRAVALDAKVKVGH